MKKYGLELSTYSAKVTFAPTGAAGEITGDFTNVRANVLSSLNLADFVVSVPSTILANFLQTDSNSKILAAPRLRAAEGKKTSLKIGQEVPVPVTTFQATQTGGTTFSPATSFQYRNVGVNLDITPKVSATGDISLEITAEFSLLGTPTLLSGQLLPTFLTRNVVGVLRLRDGETSLIGGLLQQSEADSFTGILGMQSIPILNKIFTSRNKQVDENEILISITPHILRSPKVTEEDLTALVVGTEEIPKVEGARPPLFGPPSDAPAPGAAPGARGPAAAPPSSPGVPPRAPSAAAPGGAALTPPMPARPSVEPSAQPPAAQPPVAVPSSPEASAASQGEPAAASAPASSPEEARRVTAQLSAPDAVKMGEIVTVSLVLVGLRDLSGLEAVLTLDPGLEMVEAAPGSLLTLDGAAVGAERVFEAGRARVKFTRPTGVSGSGVVMSFRVRGLRAGPAVVGLESLSLFTASGVERPAVSAAARVTVNP
jgi:general secretion pathway protein D